jgi:CBS domain-containing protein
MQVKEIMTGNPTCAKPETPLEEVAQMMTEIDCGEIPVVENFETNIPVGVVTDRDIVCRAVAKSINPVGLGAYEVMTKPVVTVTPDMSLEDCCNLMEEKRIRRVPVVDAGGAICGIISLADVARNMDKSHSAEVLQEVSEKTAAASNVS